MEKWEKKQHLSPIKMDEFHLSMHKYICSYYKINLIYKANNGMMLPRKKNKKNKRMVLIYIKMLNSRTNQSLWCVSTLLGY